MSHLPTGMFQPGDSVIHKLHPTVKLIAFLAIVVMIVLNSSLLGYLVFVALITGMIFVAKIKVKTAFRSVHRLRWFFVIIFAMNFCFYGAEDAWVQFGIFAPSIAGIMQGIHVVARVFLVLVLSNILTLTTAPMALTKSIEQLLMPLRIIRIPTKQIAMILSVAIQFIPTLFEETDMIRKAQMARGARFDSHRLIDKAKAVLPLVVPIFLAAFKRADELSLAMEARGYQTAI